MTLPYESPDSNALFLNHDANENHETEANQLLTKKKFPDSPPSTQSIYFHSIEHEPTGDFYDRNAILPLNTSNTMSDNIGEIEEYENIFSSLTNDFIERTNIKSKKNDTRFLIQREIQQLKQKVPTMVIKDASRFDERIKPGHYLKDSRNAKKEFQLYFEFDEQIYIVGTIIQEHIEGVFRAIERTFPRLFEFCTPKLKILNPSKLRIL